MLAHLAKRIMGRSAGPKPVRTVHEVRLENRFNHQQNRRLYHPIPNRRYAQRAFSTIGLGYPHPANRRGPICLGSQAGLNFIHKTLDPIRAALDVFEGNPVHTGLPFVGTGNLICTAQHVTPIDPIIQRVKPKPRLQLRLPVKLLSQRGEFGRQPDLLDMGVWPHIYRSPKCQLFRNGISFQAAHSFSDSARPQQGPFAPSCFQDFLATMGLSDSQPRQIFRLFIPGYPSAPPPSRGGSPRFLDASFRARPPQPPRGAPQVHTPVASLQVPGFIIFGSLAAPT